MKPPRSILDPLFVYRDSAHTDVGKTFARIRRRMKREQAERAAKVVTMPIKGAK